jgi:hypothetical protein
MIWRVLKVMKVLITKIKGLKLSPTFKRQNAMKKKKKKKIIKLK